MFGGIFTLVCLSSHRTVVKVSCWILLLILPVGSGTLELDCVHLQTGLGIHRASFVVLMLAEPGGVRLRKNAIKISNMYTLT